jgi:hypothetical protein
MANEAWNDPEYQAAWAAAMSSGRGAVKAGVPSARRSAYSYQTKPLPSLFTESFPTSASDFIPGIVKPSIEVGKAVVEIAKKVPIEEVRPNTFPETVGLTPRVKLRDVKRDGEAEAISYPEGWIPITRLAKEGVNILNDRRIQNIPGMGVILPLLKAGLRTIPVDPVKLAKSGLDATPAVQMVTADVRDFLGGPDTTLTERIVAPSIRNTKEGRMASDFLDRAPGAQLAADLLGVAIGASAIGKGTAVGASKSKEVIVKAVKNEAIRGLIQAAVLSALGLSQMQNIKDIEDINRDIRNFITAPRPKETPPDVPPPPVVVPTPAPTPTSTTNTLPEGVGTEPILPQLATLDEPAAPPLSYVEEREEVGTTGQTREERWEWMRNLAGAAGMSAVSGLIRSLPMLYGDSEMNVQVDIPKGGGGSGSSEPTAPTYCQLPVKEALESGDVSKVPQECMEFYNWALRQQKNSEVSSEGTPVTDTRRTTKRFGKPGFHTRARRRRV